MSGPWLIGCERSGAVRRAMRARGVEAVSCDLVPADDGSNHHIVDDIQEVIKGAWGGAILFPDCTYLTSAGLHWNKRVDGREALTEAALNFVERLWAHRKRIGKMAIENPIGCLSTRSSLGKPSQIIQPNQFGDDASKATCLWLYGLRVLKPHNHFPPRIVEWPRGSDKLVKRWGNQTDSGQNKLPPSADRAKLRAETYPGVAEAMAEWAAMEQAA
jgi:hypothetical protein